MSASFESRIAHYVSRVENVLDEVLPAATVQPKRLHDAMRYAVFNGGKRVRPLLVYAAGECLGLREDALDAPAAAIELIHAFSLVHDDLPAMDDDDIRRGKPTVHRQFDEATAILAADALQPLAFSVLANVGDAPPGASARLVGIVADAAGSIGMTGGQSMDLAAEGKSLTVDEIEHMYALKTGALIHAAVMCAAALSENLPDDRASAIDAFGRTIGIAFQIKDDILDVEGDTEVIGKRSGADQRLGKATFPGLVGIDEARARCGSLLRSALEQLDDFGADADSLRWLARFVVERGN
ncbi:MAG: polyprenyl synthetase family protein [Woeseiaceae bacterium]|nr:polyprenyl synthetase family protein [Woeseiaceae bacterium]